MFTLLSTYYVRKGSWDVLSYYPQINEVGNSHDMNAKFIHKHSKHYPVLAVHTRVEDTCTFPYDLEMTSFSGEVASFRNKRVEDLWDTEPDMPRVHQLCTCTSQHRRCQQTDPQCHILSPQCGIYLLLIETHN